MRTLSVDDNPSVLTIMSALLSRIDPDGEHRTASSADAATAVMQEYAPDVLFLDIEMPGMNGIEYSMRLQETHPQLNVIFITGHVEYAYDAHQVFASGFLCKPIRERDIRTALQNLRHPLPEETHPLLRVQCFGDFGVFNGSTQVIFSRSKTLELFAYLVYRRGAMCTNGELITMLWNDSDPDSSKASYLRKLIKDLRDTLAAIGAEEVIVKEWNSIGINPRLISCDFYNYLNGSNLLADRYHGSFMGQYTWAREAKDWFTPAE